MFSCGFIVVSTFIIKIILWGDMEIDGVRLRLSFLLTSRTDRSLLIILWRKQTRLNPNRLLILQSMNA